MNPSEAERLREERAQNMELMEQKFKKEPLSVQTEEEQRNAHDIIIRNLSSFPKCSYCFTERRTCDQAKPKCTTCIKWNRVDCQPITVKSIRSKERFEKAVKVCIAYGWILRDLTEDESRFLERARAQHSLLGCDYCIKHNMTACEIPSSQPPCKSCANRNIKDTTNTICRPVSNATILEKRTLVEDIIRKHYGTQHAIDSQHQFPHLQQHSLGQPGPSMHSGRSHQDLDPFFSQGIVPMRQEHYTNPFAEASFTGVGSSPPEPRVQSEEEIAQRNARITRHEATQANPWMNQQLPHSHAI